MNVKLSPDFYRLYKKANVRIQIEIDRKLRIFKKDPSNSELKNHELHNEYEGLRSINITSDHRAIYEEIIEDKDKKTAYFHFFGTHKELYETEEFKIKVKVKK